MKHIPCDSYPQLGWGTEGLESSRERRNSQFLLLSKTSVPQPNCGYESQGICFKAPAQGVVSDA